jgi:hypothetical protein
MPKWSLVNSKALCRDSITARILEYCSQLANPIYFFSLVKDMNKTKNIQNKNKNKLFVASIAMVVALALIANPMVAMDDAFATKKKKGNVAQQAIDQSQSSVQNALCVSGTGTFVSCNNFSFQNQKNTGNNALAQQGSGKGGNSAEQSISQSQSSKQNSQVVSGGDTIGSGNNVNVQNQENSGNNALAQQGNGKGGNSAEQSISQSQSSSQNSQVVSGGDTIGSGNNFNSQSQTNSGSNAAAQS